MPWDGDGNFVRGDGTHTGSTTWDQARQANEDVNAADHDTHDEDLADGLELCLARDGQNEPTNDLPMGGRKHTGVADADDDAQYASYGQLLALATPFVGAADVGGTANAITLAPTPALTEHVVGKGFRFIIKTEPTGAVTVAVSGTAAVQMRKSDGSQFGAGELLVGRHVTMIYNGVRYLTDIDQAPTAIDVSAIQADLGGAPADTDRLPIMDDSDDDKTKFLEIARLKTWVRSIVSGKVRSPHWNAAKDISQAVLSLANAGINPQGVAVDADGDVLVADDQADAVWGFRAGARHAAKDISQAVLSLANASINPRGVAVDADGDVLVVDNAADAVWGFRAGARHAAKDISQAVLRSANAGINPRGVAVDADGDVLVVDNAADAVWGFRAGARHVAKDISQAVLRLANASIDPQGVAVDADGDVLVVDNAADAVWGFRAGARHVAKDISQAVLHSANAGIDPQGVAVDADGDVLVADDAADAVWGVSYYRVVIFDE